ncbi:MAG: pentapeptide repeat-containing protein [Candidatus Nanopelagicales bacterium]|nr:pentapeptide repeat-containing protein [Candidatus Nanopelagicales bacterium]MCF8536994.1 pentapeptide repeat-containing protein [Candidatus Nanopelagicales bacterium]MCF8542477.1 pentapeptide repeat-containing protein [Candidatus Nanopelagicales bacterium]MCF8556851.1 pentapeptide repeat-containing protein [Candidatus Nanopelagicales bacterium]
MRKSLRLITAVSTGFSLSLILGGCATSSSEAALGLGTDEPSTSEVDQPTPDVRVEDGVVIWNGCRIEPRTSCPGADLRGANLNGEYLMDANLEGANLQGASLTFTDLTRANLSSANLRFANFAHATMHDTLVYDSDASGANFTGARYLTPASIWDADVTCAVWDITGAQRRLPPPDLRGQSQAEIDAWCREWWVNNRFSPQ